MDALTDVDVLEFTQFIAGPNCAQWLAALGANVVKVEPPEGESARDYVFQQFSSYNLGGKKSVSVDLKTDEGLEIVQELAGQADVIVENYAPGVLSRYDLDYDSVSERNEDVIYCSISAFGEGGPYSGYPGIDHLMQPMSGLMAYVGYPECPNLFDGEEYLLGTNVMIDACTGAHGALLVAAALRRRDRTGEGEVLDVALFDTAISFMGTWISAFTAGEDVPLRGNSPGGGVGPIGIFETGDGKPLFIWSIPDQSYERFCEILGRPDLVEDERFDTLEDRREHTEELADEIRPAVDAHDRDELFTAFAEAGVTAGPFQDVADIVESDPHVQARGMLVDTIDPRSGEEIKTAMIPFRTGSGPPQFDPPPRVGQDTRPVLQRLGYSSKQLQELSDAGIITMESERDQ